MDTITDTLDLLLFEQVHETTRMKSDRHSIKRTRLAAIAVIACGLIAGACALTWHAKQNQGLEDAVEKLRDQGAIVENVYPLLADRRQQRYRTLSYVSGFLCLLGCGSGVWLLIRSDRGHVRLS